VSELLEDSRRVDSLLADDSRLAQAARSIDGEVAALEGEGPATPGAPAATPVAVDWVSEAHDLVDFTTGMFFPLYPRLQTVWTRERCGSLEVRLAAVLKKYNLDMGTLLGKWGPEIMLAAVIAPAVLPTWRAVKEDNAEHRARAKEKDRAAPPAGEESAPAPPAREGQGPAAPPDRVKLHEMV
jgi:hypothetical protein